MKLVTIIDSKSIAVRLGSSSLPSGTRKKGRGYFRISIVSKDPELKAYIIGLAIGDGNLSNPNGRAVRLRISCDTKYPNLIARITTALKSLFPENRVAWISKNKNFSCMDVSCYSNKLEDLLGWKANGGSKFIQNVRIPLWIKKNRVYLIRCLKGLFETDGSVYSDRGYIMINFTTIIKDLADDVMNGIIFLGFTPRLYVIKEAHAKHTRYTIRISKNVEDFILLTNIDKS
jgi:DNA-binding transcriptional regulator WhiA